jgi:hypothetical protein
MFGPTSIRIFGDQSAAWVTDSPARSWEGGERNSRHDNCKCGLRRDPNSSTELSLGMNPFVEALQGSERLSRIKAMHEL